VILASGFETDHDWGGKPFSKSSAKGRFAPEVETAKEAIVPLPQLFVGVTVTAPPEVPNNTVISVVFCPDVMVAPAGTVHT
jgi:hypothetical protein